MRCAFVVRHLCTAKSLQQVLFRLAVKFAVINMVAVFTTDTETSLQRLTSEKLGHRRLKNEESFPSDCTLCDGRSLNPSVRVCVCLSRAAIPEIYLWNRWTDRHEILGADPLWPWLGPLLVALRYVICTSGLMDDVTFGPSLPVPLPLNM